MPGFFKKIFSLSSRRPKRFGLVGRHISYSLSPVMHKACYEEMGIDAEYGLYDIELARETAQEELNSLIRREGLSGFNVTVPYKALVMETLLSSDTGCLDQSAELAGAVNTVKVNGRDWKGYSTDGEGFYRSLRKDLRFDPASKKVLILGGGGAGGSICMYLASLQDKAPSVIYVHDLDAGRLSGLERKARVRDFSSVRVLESSEEMEKVLSSGKVSLLVNATPVGTRIDDPPPVDPELIKNTTAVYDLVYAHRTRLLEKALEKGLACTDGRGMLAGQGAVSAAIWLGVDADEACGYMEKALSSKEL